MYAENPEKHLITILKTFESCTGGTGRKFTTALNKIKSDFPSLN